MPIRLLVLLLPTFAFAQPKAFTPEQAAIYAKNNHPVLQIGELRVVQAESRLNYTGVKPNPKLNLHLKSDLIHEANGEFEFEVAFRQTLPNTARLERQKELRAVEIFLAAAELSDTRHHLGILVRRAATEYALGKAQRALLQEQLEVNRGIVGFLEERLAAAEASELEIQQAKLTSRELERKLRAIDLAQSPALLKVKRLMGLEPEAPLEITLDVSLPERLEPVPQPDWANYPDLLLMQAKIAAAKAGVAFEESREKQDRSWSVLLNHLRTEDRPGGVDGNSFLGIGYTVPLPLRRQNEAGIANALGDLGIARAELEIQQRELLHAYAAAVLRRETAWALARDANGEILELASSILKDMQQAQAAGQIPHVQVQRSLEKLIQLRSEGLEATLEFHRADSALRGDFHGLGEDGHTHP